MARDRRPNDSASAPQACLDITRSASRLEFICTSPLKRFFSLDARLGGNVSVARGPNEEGTPTSVIEVPVTVGASRHVVQLVHGRAADEQKGTVLEAVSQSESDGSLQLRFVIGDEKDRAWYRFTLPAGLDLLDFQAIERVREIARSIPSVSQLSGLVRGALALEASPRDVFKVLSDETPFAEAREILEVWQGDNPILWGPDEVAALAERWGLRVSLPNLEGAALYAEALCGAVTPHDFERLTAGDQIHALSMYTVETLAAALRLPFLALTMPSESTASWAALLQMSPKGVVQRKPDGGWRLVMQGQGGDTPSGEVLVLAPVISRLGEQDLALFLEGGRTAFACFQSDLDRRRTWQRVQADTPLTFIEGFRTFRFQGTVLGDLRADDDGASDLPRVFKDHRGSLHYVSPTATPDPRQMEDGRQRVHLLAPSDLPDRLDEVSADRLVPHAGGGLEVRRLERLQQALGRIAATYGGAADLEVVTAHVDTPSLRATLEKVVDAHTLDHLGKTWLLPSAPLELRPLSSLGSVLDDGLMLDFAALSLVQALCASDLATTRGVRKGFKAIPLRALLRDHLLHVLDHRTGAVKAAACHLLATRACVGTANEQSLVEYELQRRLDDPEAEVAEAAAVALTRIALATDLPLPPAWRVGQPPGAPADAAPAASHQKELAAVAAAWASLRKRLAGALGGGDDGAPVPAAVAAWHLEVRQALEAAPLEQGRIILGGADLADAVGERILRMIRTYAEETGLTMEEMLADGVGPWMRFVAQREAADIHGGPDAEEEELGLDVFRAAAICAPEALWLERDGRVSPFATALLRRVAESGVGAVRLARTPLSARSVLRLPAALHLQIHDAASGHFQSLLQMLIDGGALNASAEEAEMLDMIAAVVPKPAPPPPPAPVEAPPPPPAVEPPPPPPPRRGTPIPVEAATDTQRARARRLVEAFALGAPLEQPVLYLMGEAALDEVLVDLSG